MQSRKRGGDRESANQFEPAVRCWLMNDDEQNNTRGLWS